MKIVVSQGLDLSLQGAPKEVGFYQRIDPALVAIDLRPYQPVPLRLHVKAGDSVVPGMPVAEYKNVPPGTFITSSCHGVVQEIRRGEKRSLLDILIKKTPGQNSPSYAYDLTSLSSDQLLNIFKRDGLFALFKQRPFDIPALPTSKPRDIFINLADNRPFMPSGGKILSIFSSKEEGLYNFVVGVQAIAKAFGLRPHIVTTDRLVLPLKDLQSIAEVHTVKGPFPSGSPSTHIHWIAPIRHEKDVVFTISFQEVLTIGHLFLKGKVLSEQIVAVSGAGLSPKQRRYVITHKGAVLSSLLNMSSLNSTVLISGDPLTGRLCSEETPCLGLRDFVVSVLSIPQQRESFSFLRLGLRKPTLTRAYLSGFFKKRKSFLKFDATLHGEHRPIIDTDLHTKMMAFKIPVIPLIKSIITKDFESAYQLGLLQVAPEDFALPTFIDPSKTEMVRLVKEALKECCRESGILSADHA